jgi:hypothetical protein
MQSDPIQVYVIDRPGRPLSVRTTKPKHPADDWTITPAVMRPKAIAQIAGTEAGGPFSRGVAKVRQLARAAGYRLHYDNSTGTYTLSADGKLPLHNLTLAQAAAVAETS